MSSLSLFLVKSTVAKASFLPLLMHFDLISRTSPSLAAFRYLIQVAVQYHTDLRGELLMYDIFMSTLTPGLLEAIMMDIVDIESTRVAVKPPWRVPPAFK